MCIQKYSNIFFFPQNTSGHLLAMITLNIRIIDKSYLTNGKYFTNIVAPIIQVILFVYTFLVYVYVHFNSCIYVNTFMYISEYYINLVLQMENILQIS
jgi:hypothetical protein